MAETALGSVLRVVLQNLTSPIVEEFGLLWGVKDELDRLRSTLSMIQALLEDASKWQNQGRVDEVWLSRLEDVVYDADDILDEFSTVAKLRDVACGSKSSKAYKLRRFFSSLDPSKVVFQRDLAHRIKQIREKIDEIGKDASNLRLREIHGVVVDAGRRATSTSGFTDISNIIGRDREKEQIINFLYTEPLLCNPPLRIIPIVGVGGLGKTTLAQLVYNDVQMQTYFNYRIWISVSPNLDAAQLTTEIIKSFNLMPQQQMQLHALQMLLANLLYGRRYLLVLDNACDESNHAKDEWNKLLPQLMLGAAGSTILITTRSQNVASNMGNITYYPLPVMSTENCFELLKFYAFENGNPSAHPNLVTIGRELAYKCDGLPLAAKTLGRLLNSAMDEQEWNTVLNSDTWNLHSKEYGIMAALKLSYQHLPSNLKRCFAFCSLFPKGYVFKKDTLVRLWMAQGYIHPEGHTPMELIGERYFDALLKRSLFQYTFSHQQNKSEYIMHDLIHDLAQSISMGSHLRVESVEMNNTMTTRHLLTGYVSKNVFEAAIRSKNLRTLLVLRQRGEWFTHFPDKMFKNLKRLRVLSLYSIFQLQMLPKCVGDMKHLRYLDLTLTCIRSLPSSVCKLYNLQTLILSSTCLNKLPSSIGDLINLEHLDLSSTYLRRLPKSIGNLINLKHLSLSSRRLRSLPNSIGKLRRLQHFDLSGCFELESLPKSVEDLAALLYLDLSRTKLGGLPESVCNLENLETLKISGCSFYQLPTSIGDLANLRHLYVDGCRNLLSMSAGVGRLSSLQTLPTFVVSRAPECGLSQLNSMTYLQGKLHISRLENATHTEECNLQDKPHLSELQLEWSYTYTSDIPQDGEAQNQLLESLQPHTNLTKVGLYYYSGTELPSWLGNPLFKYITTLRFYYCRKLKLISPLGKLPSLKYLEIEENNEVQCINHDVSDVRAFPSLEILKIHQLRNLEEWLSVEGHEYPRLKMIHIRSCDNLTTMPHHLSGVTTLKLDGCRKLNCLPVLPNIQTLELMGCSENVLNSLPHLTSLSDLEICSSNIDSWPRNLLQTCCSLRRVTFNRCDSIFDPSKWQGLDCPISAESLVIQRFFRLNQLPENGWPRTIRHLRLYYLCNIETLPDDLKNIGALWKLEVDNCPKLMSLPDNGLPPSLEYLSITQCPILAKGCKRNSGKDWHKISHIPHLRIN